MFVVERSRVIWPKKCPRAATPVTAELQSVMRKELGERGVLVGAGRAEEVVLGAPECMPGECGSGQFVVPLVSSETERVGLFLPAGAVDTLVLHPLKLVSVEGTGTRTDCGPGCPHRRGCLRHAATRLPSRGGTLPPPGVWSHASPTSSRAGSAASEIQGRGELRGNGSPAYDAVRFRMLEARDGKSTSGPWHGAGAGTGLAAAGPGGTPPGTRRGARPESCGSGRRASAVRARRAPG